MRHPELFSLILLLHSRLQLLELEYVFCPCFFGAAVPPVMFAFYVSEQLELQALRRISGLNELDSVGKELDGPVTLLENTGKELDPVTMLRHQDGEHIIGLEEEEEEEEGSPVDFGEAAARQPLDVVQTTVSKVTFSYQFLCKLLASLNTYLQKKTPCSSTVSLAYFHG
jgi:hypothetical protein